MKKSTTIGSLVQGFKIIDVIAESDIPLKFTEIQDRTEITKSNLYKYLNTLTLLGLLYRDPRQGHYSLGYKFVEYGNVAMRDNDLVNKLTPYFREISNMTNMSVSLSVWLNDTPVLTNIWNTNYGLNIGAQIGTKLPLMSAAGKIFAAFGTDSEITDWIGREQKKIPDFNPDEFQIELEKIRRSHVAFAREPLIKHVSSWALPILDYKNELLAVFAVIGFTEDVPKDLTSPVVKQVIELSKEMSRAFGYKGE